MPKLAVVQTGGKQYLVKKEEVIVVDSLEGKPSAKIELNTLALIDTDKESVNLGNPFLKEKVKAQLINNVKGDKIRVARFKAKVRYRKVKGFRPKLSRLKIIGL